MSWNFFDSWKSKRVSEKGIECTSSDLLQQEKKCKKSYDTWQECVDMFGFNDPRCRETQLQKYYKCINHFNRMKVYLEDKDLHKA